MSFLSQLDAHLPSVFIARWMADDKPPVSVVQFCGLAEKPQDLQIYGVHGTKPKGYNVHGTEPKS
uniref:Uncharacterized protein n=1 Tax=Arion vulgaris TaxID=1028688 RepID=A0A0B7B1Q3_9EUPU